MKLTRLVVIGLVLFISPAFGQAGKPVQVPSKTIIAQAPIRLTPTLQAADFEWGNINAKGYKLSVVIENTGKEEMQLGDALFLWEIGPEETWNSVVLQLEKPETPKKTEQVSFRYAAKEEHMISPEGFTTIAASGSGGFSVTTTKLCDLGKSDKGFGLVSAGGKRTFSWDMPMPVFSDKKVVSSVWVSLPEMRFSASGRTWAPWIKFVPDGDTLKLQTMNFLLLNTNQLRNAFQGTDLLLRLLASAKLAESDPQSAEPLLAGVFSAEKALIVRCALAGNLGWMGSKAAAQPLLAVLDSAHDFFFRTVMTALSQIHPDDTVQAFLKQLNRNDYSELYFTIDTLAKMKDQQIIPALEEFRKQIKQLPFSSRQKDNLDYAVEKVIGAGTGSVEKTKRLPEATASERTPATSTSQKDEQNTQDLRSIFDNGIQLAKIGKYDEAILAYQKALDISPKQPNILAYMAEALTKLGRKDEALAAYEKAISLHTTDAALFTNMGIILGEMGKIQDAQRAFEKAASLNPAAAAQNYYNLGAILVNAGQTAPAIDALKQAIVADTGFAEAYFQLGRCFAKNPDTSPEAINALNEYVRIGRNQQHVEKAKELIQTLKKQP
jgi:tetratricopeptide (TPR) repeat protein